MTARPLVPCAHCGLPARDPGADARPYCCLGCRIAWQISGADGDEGQAQWIHARFLLAALFSVAVMMISLILYSEELYGSEIHSTSLGQLGRWGLLALATPVLLLLAPSLVDPAPQGWRRLASLDLWILTAVGAAWSLSTWRVLQGHGSLYFESATMVLVLVTLGRYLDARAKVRVGESAAKLRELIPETAQRLRGGLLEEVPVAAVLPGDRVRTVAGDRVPVDGRVVHGTAWCDFAAITGEHRPRAAEPGSEVPAGVVLVDGALEVEAAVGAGDRVIDRIAEALELARSRRTPSLRLADRLAGWMLPAALALAAGVLAVHVARGSAEAGVSRALAVLLVSCPCALGLAAPLATASAVGRALHDGILVKDAAALEVLPKAQAVLFDKTGTLTHSERELREVVPAGSSPMTGEELREKARALAAASRHPAARAFHSAGPPTGPADATERARAAEPALPDAVETLPGRGISGVLAGRRWWLGSRALMQEKDLALPPVLAAAWERIEGQGGSPVALGCAENGVMAVFHLSEALRPGSEEVLQALRARGLAVEVLTGDGPASAAALAGRLGVPVTGGLLPEQKEAAVASRKERYGPLVYVGDGVNDGPALARADVSAALGGGTEVARAAADFVLLRDDLRALPGLFSLGAATRRRIRFNLAWALSYNPLFLFLAVRGSLSPVVCAFAMAASSILVTGLSLVRPPRSGEPDAPAPAWIPSSTPSS